MFAMYNIIYNINTISGMEQVHFGGDGLHRPAKRARMKFTIMNFICRPQFSEIKYMFFALLEGFNFKKIVVLNQIILCPSRKSLDLCSISVKLVSPFASNCML